MIGWFPGLILAAKQRHQARIDAAGNIAADRHIGAQVHFDRILHQLLKPSHEIGRRVVEIDIVVDVPIASDFDAAVLHHQHLSGQELLDAAEKRLFADRVLECQIFCEGASVRFDRG